MPTVIRHIPSDHLSATTAGCADCGDSEIGAWNEIRTDVFGKPNQLGPIVGQIEQFSLGWGLTAYSNDDNGDACVVAG